MEQAIHITLRFNLATGKVGLNGHEWCTDDPWAYGLTALIWDDLKCKAPFHPTPEGQKAIAQRVYDAILPMLE